MLMLMHHLIVLVYIFAVDAKECEDLSDHVYYPLLQQDEICGRSANSPTTSNRIVWGNKTALGAYPWMVVISISKELNNGSFALKECAGTLINNRYVMTAANCFDGDGTNTRVKVWLRVYQENRLGIINCDLQKCSLPPLLVEGESFVLHPDYNGVVNLRDDDIALIRLKEKVQFDDFVRPICLPLACEFRSFDFVGTVTTMLGWDNIGVNRTGLEKSALEKSQMLVFSQQKCQELWGDDLRIQPSFMCAYWPGGRAACSKDVGGPLLTETHRDGLQMYQIGIIKQGLCDDNYSKIGRPTVYVRVGDYIPFILKTIKP